MASQRATKESLNLSDSEDELDQLTVLKKRQRNLEVELFLFQKDWKTAGQFDSSYWKKAAEIEKIGVKRSLTERNISQSSFSGKEIDWEATEEAKKIMENINAHQQSLKICSNRAESLIEKEKEKGRTLRASFMKLFTISKMGINISWTGAGKRKKIDQSSWRFVLIEVYKAKHPKENQLWCPIIQTYRSSRIVVAAHIFAYMHGQSTMDAIFGKGGDIFSAQNGILISKEVEHHFDSGKMALVPNIGENTGLFEILGWLNSSQPREFKVKILDWDWDQLDMEVDSETHIHWRDLDGRPLVFKSDFRPAARYLYFHYCVQVLRRSWQLSKKVDTKDLAAATLRNEDGKFCWGTPGRYIPKNMLLALVEELGHQYEPLLAGASSSTSSESDTLLEVAANQTKAKRKCLPENFFSNDFEIDDPSD